MVEAQESINAERIKAEATISIEDDIRDAKRLSRQEELARRLKEELGRVKIHAEEYLRRTTTDSKEMQGNAALTTLVRVITAMKKGIPVVEAVANRQAYKLLINIADQSGRLTPHTAAMIEVYLNDYLTGDKRIDLSPGSDFLRNYNELRYVDSIAGRIIADSIIQEPDAFNITEVQAQERLGATGPPREPPREPPPIPPVPEDPDAERLRRAYEAQRTEQEQMMRASERERYGRYLSLDEEFKLVEAMNKPEDFVNYIKNNVIPDVNRLNPGISNDKLGELVSEEIRSRITQIFSKLYSKLDREKPQEFFDQIVQQDFYKGILTTSLELKGKISTLMSYFSSSQGEVLLHNTLHDFHFYKKSDNKIRVEDVPVKTKDWVLDATGKLVQREVIKPRYIIEPLMEPKQIHFHDFIHYLEITVDNYIELRKYTHNGKAVFYHPVDSQKGFWSQLAHFSEEMPQEGYDSAFLLPDGDIFMQALHLYDKCLDEQFAAQDWRHTPHMFTNERNDYHTRLENDVLGRLRIMFKDRNISDDRLVAALSMAVGASRAMFLNEVEKAAYADVHLNIEKGMGESAAFTSYYLQDQNPLVAFNPMHFWFRFQTEGSNFNPIYFIPVEGEDLRNMHTWDHKVVWKNMQKYRDSFLQGKKVMPKGQTLLADFVINIGNVGGPFKRGGWRSENWFKGYMEYIGGNVTKLDHLKTWKNLENIGYEALSELVNKRMQYKNLLSGDGVTQRNDFFRYIYRRFFDPPAGSDDATIDNLVNSRLRKLREQAKEEVYKNIRENKFRPDDVNQEIEIEVMKIFLNQTLNRVIAFRMPTKFLRMDRDRFSDDGESRWRKIAKKMGLNTEKFDEVMKDMLLTESLLRQRVSKNMRDRLSSSPKGTELFEICDSVYDTFNYRITEANIRTLLAGKLDGTKIENVVRLFNTIKAEYLVDDANHQFINNFNLNKTPYPYTFALDEIDMSFISFSAAGPRVLARAIGDVANTEMNVQKIITDFPKLLHQVALAGGAGKKDFSEIVKAIKQVKDATTGILGPDDAAKIAHHMAGMAINYFKKDTAAKTALGIGHIGAKSSIAAEIAGRAGVVMEWESKDIDKFCIALESNDIIKKNPYLHQTSEPKYENVYLNGVLKGVPIIGNFLSKIAPAIKLPFKVQHEDIKWYGDKVRKEYGANWKNFLYDSLNKYLPIAAAIVLFFMLKKAFEEWFGKKERQ